MAVVCDDLWPVISDVNFVTTDLRLDLLIHAYSVRGRVPVLTVVSNV